MFQRIFGVLPVCLLGACMTLSGNYEVKAFDAQGQELRGPRMMAQGRGIYTVKNAVCQVYPKSTLKVFDTDTGEEVRSEQRHCR